MLQKQKGRSETVNASHSRKPGLRKYRSICLGSTSSWLLDGHLWLYFPLTFINNWHVKHHQPFLLKDFLENRWEQ